jgi:nicotinamidase/pyrazinamidase
VAALSNADQTDTALIVVDMQNDFMPGGALGVPGADRLAPAIKGLADYAGTVVFTRDAHDADHCSFVEQGGTWPPHCVKGTWGTELHESVRDIRWDGGVVKGNRRDHEAYSGFDGTMLAPYLRNRGTERVLIVGVATEYCVKATAMDALKEGFETVVVADAIAAVDSLAGGVALYEMQDAGVAIA